MCRTIFVTGAEKTILFVYSIPDCLEERVYRYEIQKKEKQELSAATFIIVVRTILV